VAKECLALDGRILGLLKRVGVEIKRGSLDRNYEKIEEELIEKIAAPNGLSGGQLDRILFQNYGDITVRLLAHSGFECSCSQPSPSIDIWEDCAVKRKNISTSRCTAPITARSTVYKGICPEPCAML
jgi:hypothetical protein